MRLTESDSSFLYGETASGPLQTAGVSVLDGEASFQSIYNHIEARLHLVPQFRQRLVWVPLNLAHPKWVDDPNFNLDNHIVHHSLAEGSSLLDGVDAACKLNEGLMNRERPLWKFFVITGVPDRTLVLQQIHHAMIDGASAVHLSTVLFDYQPQAEVPPPPKEKWTPQALPNPFELANEAMRESMEDWMRSNPLQALSQGEDNMEMLRQGVQMMSRFSRPAITAPWNAGPLGPKRKMRWLTYDFAEFREIRRAFGGTVNDVVLTAVTEGAARYLESHNEFTENQNFRIMCPVNVRTENEAGALGNRVSAMFPMLPAWSMNPLERLKVVIAETSRIKEAQEAQAMTKMQESGFSTPPMAFAALQLVGTPFDPTNWAAQNPTPVPMRFGPRPPFFGINFVCTNVPGVQVPQYFAGHEILETLAIMMMGGTMGLGMAVTSYNQKMILNLTCEPRLLPDLEQLIECTAAGFEEMLTAARTANAA